MPWCGTWRMKRPRWGWLESRCPLVSCLITSVPCASAAPRPPQAAPIRRGPGAAHGRQPCAPWTDPWPAAVPLCPLLGRSQRLAFRNVVSTRYPHNSTQAITAHNRRKYHMSLRRARSRVGPPTPHVAAGACTYGTLPGPSVLHPQSLRLPCAHLGPSG